MEHLTASLHVLLFVSETALQILTAAWNYQIASTYCWLVVAFIVVSSLVTNSVSLAWVYKSMDFADRRTGECLCIGLHTFQLGIPWRYLKLWLAGDPRDSQELTVLRLIQTSIQSGPFLIFQTWLALDNSFYHKLPLAAIGVSLISLAYTYASNTEPLHKALQLPPERNSSFMQFATRFFLHCFIMVARFVAIAIFGLLTRSWLVLALVTHFVVSTIIMIIHNFWRLPKSSSPNKLVIWTTFQSYGCTYSPVPFCKMSYPHLLYFIVIFLENLIMSTVWFIQRASTPENVVLYTISLTSFLAGFIIACIYSKTLGIFSRSDSDLPEIPKLPTKSILTQSSRVRYDQSVSENTVDETRLTIEIDSAPKNMGPKTSSLKSLGIPIDDTQGISTLDDLDEVIPSPYFLTIAPSGKLWNSNDSGVEPHDTTNDSVESTSNRKGLPEPHEFSESISSGCCTDDSITSFTICDKVSTPKMSVERKLASKSTNEAVKLHSTPKVSAIEITDTERMLIDSLLRTAECMLDGQDGELSSSGCFGESSSEYSSVSNKLLDVTGQLSNDTAMSVQQEEVIKNRLNAVESTLLDFEVPKEGSVSINPQDSDDVLSTTYQTISTCPSDFPQFDRKLPSLTSSVTRTWADAALSSSTSTCDTCTTCRESYDRSCSDSSWSSSQDTLDLLESDTDRMTWPPRKVNIVNLHDLPREKLSLDDRISKWLGDVSLPSRSQGTPPPKPKRAESSQCLKVPEKAVFINSRPSSFNCNIKSKRTKLLPLNSKPHTEPKKQLILNNRPLSRSHSLSILVKLCNAASFRRKKVILFNHLREECQRHRDPVTSRFALS